MQEYVDALLAGHLVAFPTETVYGLGGDAGNDDAVARIFHTKGRPADHPLIVHLAESSDLDRWGRDIPEYSRALAEAFWPGAMTVILPAAPGVSSLVTGGQATLGLRVPSHPVARELLATFRDKGGSGVAAPSANRFGRVSPTTADAVYAELAEHLHPADRILEGGPCEIGVESTIIDCTGEAPSIVRPGVITHEMIQRVTGYELRPFTGHLRASGTLASHYSPLAVVVLDQDSRPGDGLLAPAHYPTPEGVVRLLEAGTAEDYARDLYASLRQADELGLSRVVAVMPEGEGISEAVRDRLTRASNRTVRGGSA